MAHSMDSIHDPYLSSVHYYAETYLTAPTACHERPSDGIAFLCGTAKKPVVWNRIGTSAIGLPTLCSYRIGRLCKKAGRNKSNVPPIKKSVYWLIDSKLVLPHKTTEPIMDSRDALQIISELRGSR